MAFYREMNKEQLTEQLNTAKEEYKKFQQLSLSLNMARGKPAPDQLDLSNILLEQVSVNTSQYDEDGFDCRNYGLLEGIPEAKRFFADLLDVSEDMIIVGGNSSLNMEFDFIAQGMNMGFGQGPWSEVKDRKFLCPAPGYDRHFAITEYFGFELIPIAMLDDGPDMDEVEKYVKDPSVKGIWCVPKYSNPTGITFSRNVVERMAALKPAAKDFKIMWDNAYVCHTLGKTDDELVNIFDCCKDEDAKDMIVEFASTSKITFAGGGIAAMATSKNNKQTVLSRMTIQTISSDKVNQLRHSRLFPTKQALSQHMLKHAQILSPKFDLICDMLNDAFGESDILSWNTPNGGYFISVDTLPCCAKRVIQLCKDAGVILTGAGAAFPYGKDPLDSNIRIAPSFPSIDELKLATQLFIICVKYASAEMLLNN